MTHPISPPPCTTRFRRALCIAVLTAVLTCRLQLLQAERPDIEEKRSRLLRLQGEYQARMRELEGELLDELSQVKGNILDDDRIIDSLERLQKEAAEVQQEVLNTDKVMEEVTAVSNEYRSVANTIARTYFALQAFGRVHFLYQFSLSHFLAAVNDVLSSLPAADTDDGPERVKTVLAALMMTLYRRCQRSLLEEHKLVLALRMAQLVCERSPCAMSERMIAGIFASPADFAAEAAAGNGRSKSSRCAAITSSLGDAALPGVVAALDSLCSLQGPEWSALAESLTSDAEEWRSFMTSQDGREQADDVVTRWLDGVSLGDADVAQLLPGGESATIVRKAQAKLLLVRVLRPELVVQAATALVDAVFGARLLHIRSRKGAETSSLDAVQSADGLEALTGLVHHESNAKAPILLAEAGGYDAGAFVDQFVSAEGRQGAQYSAVSMGSAEGYVCSWVEDGLDVREYIGQF